MDIKKLFSFFQNFLKDFFDPKLSFYAASMSWATLFFIIPLFVIIFSIILHTPIFNEYYENIHNLISQYLMPTNSKVVMHFIDEFVKNASKIGYIGFFYVILAAIFFFRDFDFIINDIFEEKRRGFFATIAVYGGLLILIPLSIAATLWFIYALKHFLGFTPIFLQFFLLWGVILAIYYITPKEEIPFKIAALSSFIATIVWFLAKTIFIFYVYYNKTYTTIYGAISIMLFLFLWIYISWLIFLHGLQLCKVLLKE